MEPHLKQALSQPRKCTPDILPPGVLLTLCAAFWAANAIVGKAVSDHIPAFSLSFWRWILALLIILPFAWRAVLRQRRFYLRHWPFLWLISLLSIALFNTLLYWSLNWTSAINTGVISASMPVFILLLNAWTGDEKTYPRQYLGAALGIAGVVWVISRGDLAALAGFDLNRGDGLILIAVISWSFYSVLLKRLPGGVDPLGLLTVMIAFGLTGIAPFYAWDLLHALYPVVDATTVGTFLFVAIFPSLLAYVFWQRGVARGGANLAGMFVNLIPLFVALMAVGLLGETLALHHAGGLVLIFAGIWVAGRPRRSTHIDGSRKLRDM
jgi:drug/metabolite transporter (DMT)-like permease